MNCLAGAPGKGAVQRGSLLSKETTAQVRHAAFWTSAWRQSDQEPKRNHFSLVQRQDRTALASAQGRARQILFDVSAYLPACLCVHHMHPGVHRGQKRTWEPLELELQSDVSQPMWVLGTDPWELNS